MKEASNQYIIEVVIEGNIKENELATLKRDLMKETAFQNQIERSARSIISIKDIEKMVSKEMKKILKNHVKRIHINKIGTGPEYRQICCYSLHKDHIKSTLYQSSFLPHQDYDQLWTTLMFETQLKEKLLNYMNVALKFEHFRVHGLLNEWNKVIFFHGPPGCGKTSLAKALAQQCMIQNIEKYPIGELVEINAACLGSKFYSESAKQVSTIFRDIQEKVQDGIFVFVLIDELESLLCSRSNVSGSEPVDAVRVVNVFLTELDKLKGYPNVILFCTSNMPTLIDEAFLSRVDMNIAIPPPSLPARYGILKSSLLELIRTGIVSQPDSQDYHALLKEISHLTEGKSGRELRKLFFLIHVSYFSVHLKILKIHEFLQATIDHIDTI